MKRARITEANDNLSAPIESVPRIPAATLRAFLADAMRACGLPEDDAAIVAGAMLEADLTGSDAHGVFRLAAYVRQLQRRS